MFEFFKSSFLKKLVEFGQGPRFVLIFALIFLNVTAALLPQFKISTKTIKILPGKRIIPYIPVLFYCVMTTISLFYNDRKKRRQRPYVKILLTFIYPLAIHLFL